MKKANKDEECDKLMSGDGCLNLKNSASKMYNQQSSRALQVRPGPTPAQHINSLQAHPHAIPFNHMRQKWNFCCKNLCVHTMTSSALISRTGRMALH